MTTEAIAIDLEKEPEAEAEIPPPVPTGKCTECKDDIFFDLDGACFTCVMRAQSRVRNLAWCIEHLEERIPAFYRGAVLEECVVDPKAIAKARAAVKADRVTLIGPAGAGKTTLATWIARRWAKLGKKVEFLTARRLAVARSQSPLGEGEAEEVGFAMTARRAIIDDVGSEPPHPTSSLSDVIDARFSAGLPTIITCALDVDGVKARYGDGIARRIFERSVVIDVKPKGAR